MTTTLPTGVRSRNLTIDFLRGISILVVLLHHFNIPYRISDTFLNFHIFGFPLLRAIARNGNYGVTMFFVISGFLITSHAIKRWHSLDRVHIWSFYGMRIARIIPSLLLLLVIVNGLSLLELKPFLNDDYNGAPFSYAVVNFASLTFWMNVLIIKYGWVNYALGVLWSLSVEEVFYLSFPIACLFLRKSKYLILFWLVFIIIGPIYRSFHQDGDSEAYLYAYFSSFDGIAIGCCAAVLANTLAVKRIVFNPAISKVIQIVTIITMVVFYLYASIGANNIWGVTFMSFCTAILLVASVLKNGSVKSDDLLPVAKQNIIARAIRSLGKRSYELYLFHLVILGLIKVFYPPASVVGNEKILLLVVFAVGSLILSYAIARLYSDPLNRYFRKKLMRKEKGEQIVEFR
ncbi:acyltransferase family protein [Aquirhabdus parva]|uniref:Acyltransferase n=1 Tax=Aquirhabdus parva TaxID=2283318 RepID=A0A345P9L9_9GAMM|nr:acyltransferase [Aquirhabdus parva]AXI03978.1 acyltransferase [Aquirhabdus parva]